MSDLGREQFSLSNVIGQYCYWAVVLRCGAVDKKEQVCCSSGEWDEGLLGD